MKQIDLMSASTAAHRLGVTKRTVQRMATDGRLPSQKMPGKTGAFLIDPVAVEKLAAEQAAA